MNNNLTVFKKRCDRMSGALLKALTARRFDAYYCETAAAAAEKVLSLIPAGASVTWGGSMTLEEAGIINAVKKGGFEVIDRDEAASPEERTALMKKAFFCDSYLTSVNAISEDGVLVNVDGTGNRVAAMSYGPRQVIVVAGMNKIVKSEYDAEARARSYASPMNMARLPLSKTPCAVNGLCGDCKSEDCICAYIVKTRLSRPENRIKVILVGEPLGY